MHPLLRHGPGGRAPVPDGDPAGHREGEKRQVLFDFPGGDPKPPGQHHGFFPRRQLPLRHQEPLSHCAHRPCGLLQGAGSAGEQACVGTDSLSGAHSLPGIRRPQARPGGGACQSTHPGKAG